jgi:hypothetical protein
LSAAVTWGLVALMALFLWMLLPGLVALMALFLWMLLRVVGLARLLSVAVKWWLLGGLFQRGYGARLPVL